MLRILLLIIAALVGLLVLDCALVILLGHLDEAEKELEALSIEQTEADAEKDTEDHTWDFLKGEEGDE